MKTLAISAASTASQWILLSAAQASAVPTITGVTEMVSVRGRDAMIQHDSNDGVLWEWTSPIR